MGSLLIELQDLNKSYKLDGIENQVLHDITLTVNEGEFLAISGPSGGGKSTLLSILGLLEKPDSGSYLLQGEDTFNFSDELSAAVRNQLFGYVFQNFNLIPQLRVLENVMLPLTNQKVVNKKAHHQVALNYLDKVGLKDKSMHYPTQLSGGQQQRVAIARALVTSPKVIFADEPTGNLDSENGHMIMTEFENLNNDGQTIVMVTHNQKELKFANRVVTITDGKLML